MTDPTGDSTLRSVERLIGTLMPTALEMIASVVDAPTSTLDDYERLTVIAETQSPVLILALVRTAAGLAAISDMTGNDVRSLADVKASTTATVG